MTYSDELTAIGEAADAALAAAAADVATARADQATTLADLAALQARYDALQAKYDALTTPPPPVDPPAPPATAFRWALPELVNPTTLDVTATVKSFKLDSTRDYVLRLPPTVLDVGTGRLSITGGRRVVVVGGQITGSGVDGTIRATGQAEALHLEGLHLTGDELAEGIQFQSQTNAVVTVQHVKVDHVSGSYAGHHADLLQWWGGGPKALRINGFEGVTDYQGMMMQGFTGDASGWDWRNVHIRHLGTAGWTLFDAGPRLSDLGHVSDVYLEGSTTSTAVYTLKGKPLPAGVHLAPAPADFAPRAGLTYTS